MANLYARLLSGLCLLIMIYSVSASIKANTPYGPDPFYLLKISPTLRNGALSFVLTTIRNVSLILSFANFF